MIVTENNLNPQLLARMSVFAVVAKEQNLTRAAELMGLSKSAVSKQLSALEAELGLRLLFRNTRRIRLTDEGRALLPLCAELWQQHSELVDLAEDLKSSVSGRLTLELPGGLAKSLVLDSLARFSESHPMLQLDLRLSTSGLSVFGEDFDVAIVAGDLPDSSVVCRKLGDIVTYPCASPDYLSRFGRPEHPEDLLQHRCILTRYPGLPEVGRWVFMKGDQVKRLLAPTAISVDDSAAALQLACGGAGVAMLQHFATQEELASGKLIRVLEDYHCPSVPLHIVYPERQYLAPKIRAIVDHLVEVFRFAGF